jgi:hypothetical protein
MNRWRYNNVSAFAPHIESGTKLTGAAPNLWGASKIRKPKEEMSSAAACDAFYGGQQFAHALLKLTHGRLAFVAINLSTQTPDAEPVASPMFASGHCVHHCSILAGPVVASL